MADLKPVTRSNSDLLKAVLAYDENGVSTTLDEEVVNKTLPEDLEPKQFYRSLDHVATLAASLTLANGESGEEILKKNKKLDSVSAEIRLGKFGTISTQYLRSAERPKSPTDRTPVTHYGVTQTKVNIVAHKNRGELRKVRETLAERAAKLFV